MTSEPKSPNTYDLISATFKPYIVYGTPAHTTIRFPHGFGVSLSVVGNHVEAMALDFFQDSLYGVLIGDPEWVFDVKDVSGFCKDVLCMHKDKDAAEAIKEGIIAAVLPNPPSDDVFENCKLCSSLLDLDGHCINPDCKNYN